MESTLLTKTWRRNKTMKWKRMTSVFLLSMLTIILVACGNSEAKTEEDSQDDSSAGGNEEELEGSVVIDGSGTVYPLMSSIAEEYMLTEQENVSVEVSRAGTSAGFEKFLVEENGTDFNDASRQMKDEEEEKAEDIGIDVKELKVALDGLTFVVHPDNDWANELTEEQIIDIFKADGQAEKWSDIDSEFPDEPIQTYGPNENHGTYELFWENILEEEDLVSSVNLQQDYSTLVNLIAEDVNGIALFGYGYYVNNHDKLQAVHVDFGDGGVEPTLDTIAEDGDYAAFTRPVFTYLNVDQAKAKPEVLDFSIYALNNINTFAGETGFAPIPEEEVEENLDFLNGLK